MSEIEMTLKASKAKVVTPKKEAAPAAPAAVKKFGWNDDDVFA